MQNRIVSFDYLRVIAVLGIVVCHFLFNWDESTWLGRWFGSTFNSLFIMMSGILLGLSWEKKGHPSYGITFVLKRLGKLCKTYYPFLILMFAFIALVDLHELSLKDIVLHISFLSWFGKIEGFGHLWFMTMIAMCYGSLFFTSRLVKYIDGKLLVFSIILFSVLLQISMSLKGLPATMIPYLGMFAICFLKAKQIVFIEKSTIVHSIIALVFILCSILSFYLGVFDKFNSLSVWIGILTAFVICLQGTRLLRNAQESKFISFIASIGFEIYLVHHVFAFGQHSVIHIITNPILGFIVLLSASVLMAWALNRIGKIKI